MSLLILLWTHALPPRWNLGSRSFPLSIGPAPVLSRGCPPVRPYASFGLPGLILCLPVGRKIEVVWMHATADSGKSGSHHFMVDVPAVQVNDSQDMVLSIITIYLDGNALPVIFGFPARSSRNPLFRNPVTPHFSSGHRQNGGRRDSHYFRSCNTTSQLPGVRWNNPQSPSMTVVHS